LRRGKREYKINSFLNNRRFLATCCGELQSSISLPGSPVLWAGRFTKKEGKPKTVFPSFSL
jgi:hypothetical protein